MNLLRKTLSISLLIFSFILGSVSPSFSQNSEWVITNFNSEIMIPQDGKVKVVETIAVDFKTTPKHGIFRTLPVDGIRFWLREVTQDGAKVRVQQTSSEGLLTLRIGDSDETITGPHTYTISYEVGRVITRFSDHDEFYWNVTGTDWEASILVASAKVTLLGADVRETACYTGTLGSPLKNCVGRVTAGKGEFFTTQTLSPGEGLSIVNSLPAGLVSDPFYWDEFLMPYWLLLGSLLAVFLVIKGWWRHGRDLWYKGAVIDDPRAQEGIKPLFARQVVVAEFEPPFKLKPGEVGTLVDERVDIRDISATIVDLAVRGYLTIHEEKKFLRNAYRLELKKSWNADKGILEWERMVLEGIFGKDAVKGKEVSLADLKEKFYTHLSGIREKLYGKLVEGGYFPQSPDKAVEKHILKLIPWGLIAAVLFYLFSKLGLWWVPLPLAVFEVLSLLASPLMPRKSALGTEAVRRAAGFKLFISTAQRYQQEFNEKINYFDVYLPYAMVFGVVDKWVGAFKALGIEPSRPTWYVGTGAFNVGSFSSSVQAMESSFSSTLPSRPASQGGSGMGGGGFSGGGFGGGGGGSW